MTTIASDHTRLDERSLALHTAVAARIAANPELLGRARANLRRWSQLKATQAPALAEWDAILAGSVASLTALLVDRSENANRLRQSSPFPGILTEAERKAIYESFSTRTHYPGG